VSGHSMQEERIYTNKVYEGRIVNLRVDGVLLPSGRKTLREVVEHAPAVGILAVTEDEKIVLVRQYRYAVGECLVEVPAGIVEAGEAPEATAERELMEETGYKPGKLVEICRVYPSPGFSNEIIILFLATELVEESLEQDDDENIEVALFTKEEIMEMIEKGKIKDSKTLLAIFWYLNCQK